MMLASLFVIHYIIFVWRNRIWILVPKRKAILYVVVLSQFILLLENSQILITLPSLPRYLVNFFPTTSVIN